MEPLRLDDPNDLPRWFLERLQAMPADVSAARSIEHFLERPAAAALADDLEAHIAQHRVRAYHCTKELFPGLFQTAGLRILDLETHAQEVLGVVTPLASAEVAARLADALKPPFPIRTATGRPGIISFCMSPSLVISDGVDELLRYYGGEVVRRLVQDDPDVLALLEGVGEAVVVEVAAPARDFTTLRQWPFAGDMLSRALNRMNPAIAPFPLQATLDRSVAAPEVVAVHTKAAFWKEYGGAHHV